MSLRMRVLALAVAGTATLGLGIAAAAAAQAATPVVPVTNIPASTALGGESGYYAVDNGHTRFRYVTATLDASTALVDLNGATSASGAVGVELCDPNTGYAFQLGVDAVPGATPGTTDYAVAAGYGTLTGTFEDDCIQGGLLSPTFPTSTTWTTTGTATTALIAGQGTSQPIATGDPLDLSIYYNPNAKHKTVEFSVCDANQTWGCRNPSTKTGARNIYEFGVGGLTNAAGLTSPPLNLLTQFTSAAANYYSSNRGFGSIDVPGHWSLRQGVLVNASSQPIMSPDSSLSSSGSEFDLYEGSTSP